MDRVSSAARPQPDAAARSQGADHAAQSVEGQGHRHQRPRRGLDLRGRQACSRPTASRSPTSRSRCCRSRRWRSRSRNKAIDAAIVIPPFTAQLIERRLRRAVQGPRRPRQAASDVDRGQHDQHRLGEGERPRGAQLLRRLSARGARLLPGLSRRLDPRRDDRSPDQDQDRDARSRCCTNIRGRRAARTARSTRQACMDMQEWYAEEQDDHGQPAARAHGRHQLCP